MATKATTPATPPAGDWHLRDVPALIEAHGVDPALGLHEHQAADRARHYGANALPSVSSHGLGVLLLEQFDNFMVWVLLAAALISGVVGDWLTKYEGMIMRGEMTAPEIQPAMAAMRKLVNNDNPAYVSARNINNRLVGLVDNIKKWINNS